MKPEGQLSRTALSMAGDLSKPFQSGGDYRLKRPTGFLLEPDSPWRGPWPVEPVGCWAQRRVCGGPVTARALGGKHPTNSRSAAAGESRPLRESVAQAALGQHARTQPRHRVSQLPLTQKPLGSLTEGLHPARWRPKAQGGRLTRFWSLATAKLQRVPTNQRELNSSCPFRRSRRR